MSVSKYYPSYLTPPSPPPSCPLPCRAPPPPLTLPTSPATSSSCTSLFSLAKYHQSGQLRSWNSKPEAFKDSANTELEPCTNSAPACTGGGGTVRQTEWGGGSSSSEAEASRENPRDVAVKGPAHTARHNKLCLKPLIDLPEWATAPGREPACIGGHGEASQWVRDGGIFAAEHEIVGIGGTCSYKGTGVFVLAPPPSVGVGCRQSGGDANSRLMPRRTLSHLMDPATDTVRCFDDEDVGIPTLQVLGRIQAGCSRTNHDHIAKLFRHQIEGVMLLTLKDGARGRPGAHSSHQDRGHTHTPSGSHLLPVLIRVRFPTGQNIIIESPQSSLAV